MTVLSGLRLQWPIEGDYTVTDWYGAKRDYDAWGLKRLHEGIDLAALPAGRVAWSLAAFAGRVNAVGYDRLWMGHYVELSHGWRGERFYTRYHHLAYVEPIVGGAIQAGERVGVIGDTGNASGPHLHFMVLVYRNQKPVALDPMWYLPPLLEQSEARG